MFEDATDLLAAVAALKSLAGGGVTPIIPVMRKPPNANEAPPPASLAAPVAASSPARGWRRPVPAAPATEEWTTDDLRHWRERIAVTQVEAAKLLGISADGYVKLENGKRKLRLGRVRLARYIEAYGPLP